jgi:hypothetical protein
MDCLTYRDKAFEDIMNEFIILLRPYPTVQDSLILNSRYAGMLNHLSRFLMGSPSPEFVENPELVVNPEFIEGSR